ncbi:MAG: ATPase [Acidimicrobiales bacterium]
MTSIAEPEGEQAPISPPEGRPVHHSPDVESLLAEAIEMVDQARPMPLSTSSMINREELLDVLDQVVATLPDELRAARWLLREREEYLERVRLEGEEILAIARSQAERMVERTEVVKTAESRAQRLINDAQAEARLMRRETEDFCDARLAALEGILDRTRSVVATGRNRLQGVAPTVNLTEEAREAEMAETAPLFDQDFS